MTIEIVVPLEEEGTKAVVKAWFKKIGEVVAVDDPLVELETDKVAVEIAATASGVLTEILFEEGAEVEPGTVLGRLGTAESAVPTTAVPPQAAARASVTVEREALSPGVRRLLAEHNLQPSDVAPRGDKLSREDIEAEAARRKVESVGVKSVPHDRMRKRIAQHLAQSLQVAPHVTSVFEADFSAISAHRAAHRADFLGQGANLTFTAYIVAAAAQAMAAAPAVNARWYDDRIDLYEDVNVGVGTALGDKGLVVPVIHRAQSLSLLEIAQALSTLTGKARAGKLTPESVRGGTFSVSNHGVSGSLLATPVIINQSQAAILGVGKLEKRATVQSQDGIDTIAIRPMAYVTLTIDHRVIDAHQTNAWLECFVRVLAAWPV